MTERPYADDDLRAEAARQHAKLTEDPDFTGVGEQMQDASVKSTDDGETSLTWTELLVPQGAGASYEAFDEAQRKTHDLIRGAADVSEWAVDLGADGLEPHGTLQLGVRSPNPDDPEQPVVRLCFAFPKEMSGDDREHLLMRLSAAVGKAL